MKGYVYMMNVKENKDDYIGDQIECCDKQDLMEQVNIIAKGQLGENFYVDEIKLVNDKDRWVEKDISKSLYEECKRILKNRLK